MTDSENLARITYGTKPAVSVQGIVCDRCPSAPAKARAVLITGDLYLCGHHLRLGWDALTRQASEILIDVPGKQFYLPAEPVGVTPAAAAV